MTQQVEVEMMTKRGSASADVEGNWSKMNVSNINDDENREHASSRSMKIAKFATTASWIVNWFLLAAKAFCVAISGSKAVSAALADSAVDLVSQGKVAHHD